MLRALLIAANSSSRSPCMRGQLHLVLSHLRYRNPFMMWTLRFLRAFVARPVSHARRSNLNKKDQIRSKLFACFKKICDHCRKSNETERMDSIGANARSTEERFWQRVGIRPPSWHQTSLHTPARTRFFEEPLWRFNRLEQLCLVFRIWVLGNVCRPLVDARLRISFRKLLFR